MVRGLASSVSGEVSFPDLQTATSVSSYSPSSAHGWGAGGVLLQCLVLFF